MPLLSNVRAYPHGLNVRAYPHGLIMRGITLFILLAGLYGCCIVGPRVNPGAREAINRGFFDNKDDTITRDKKFKMYDLETQFDLLRWGSQCFEPPYSVLAGSFAEEGRPAVDFLKGKISTADDHSIRLIVLVFYEMAEGSLYDVAVDEDLMRVLEDRVARVKDPFWRRSEEGDIDVIRAYHNNAR